MNKTIRIIALLCLFAIRTSAQELTLDERIKQLEQKIQEQSEKQEHSPKIHGILRGKYEYEHNLDASRFEVRNARLSVEGNLPLRSSYKLEVDLCDESQMKMKDAWVRVNLWKDTRISLGQQRMPFSIDAHRNPSAQYFANRSFIAKQVGDMRDVGFQLGYSPLLSSARGNKMELHIDAGIFNGSNLDNQKTAWFSSPGYSARVQFIYTSSQGEKIGVIPSYNISRLPIERHHIHRLIWEHTMRERDFILRQNISVSSMLMMLSITVMPQMRWQYTRCR